MSRSRKLTTTRLGLENLENRNLMSVNVGIDAGGALAIVGDNRDNTVQVDSVFNPNQAQFVLRVSHDGRYTDVLQSSVTSGDIRFVGARGNDTFVNNTGLRAIADGGDGNDTIRGGSGNDYLYGGAGNDYIWGGAGIDTIFGQGGNDVLDGNTGDDFIYGGDNDDELLGGEDNDRLWGEGGTDWLWGERGNDTLNGGTGVDFMFGGEGADLFYTQYDDVASGSYFVSPHGRGIATRPGIQDWQPGEGIAYGR